jgi:phospholipid/cholesterol/gamma-HCH transport system substrate-binding protein
MEPDKRYFLEGSFILVLALAMGLAFVWLSRSGRSDDVVYRIHFAESVSGLSVGDPVKFHGVDVGSVKAMALDARDSRLVEVDVRLSKDAPVKTDTKASLKLKGITGVVLIELNGGSPGAKSLVEATAPGQIPEIAYEKGKLAALLDALPKAIESISSLGGQAKKVLSDMGVAASDIKETSAKVKEDPTLLLRRPAKKD